MTTIVPTVVRGAVPLRGWLALPDDATAQVDVGLVLCSPFDHVDVCAHRPLRTLSVQLAAAGVPVLRFDWPGAGDSADPPEAPDVPLWLGSIRAAVDQLIETTAPSRVVLGGLRIGATLAALAAAEDDRVTDLLLLEPFATGRTYLRERQAFERMTRVVPSEHDAALAPLPDGAVESAGFLIEAASAAALREIDLGRAAEALAGRRILLVTELGESSPLRAALETCTEVTHVIEPDVAALYDGTGHSALTPACASAVRAWTLAGAVPGRPPGPRPTTTSAEIAPAPGLREHGVLIPGRRGRLAAVTCEPAEPGDSWVVLLNAGAVRRIGPSRLWTTFARRWAVNGHPSLRVDLLGIGDSDGDTLGDTVPGADVASLYTPAFVADVRDALDWLAQERGARSFTVLGLCSGGYFALHTALADERVARIGLVNPRTLDWDPAERAVQSFDEALRLVVHPSRWGAARRGARPSARLAARGMVVRLLGGRSLSRSRAAAGRLLDEARSRGVGCHLVVSAGDASEQYLTDVLGEGLEHRVAELGATIDIVRGADHTFRPLWTHRVLGDVLTSRLELGPLRAGAPASPDGP